MGGVLATMLALKYQKFITKMILINPSFEYLIMKNGKLQILPSFKQVLKVLSDLNHKVYPFKKCICSLQVIKEFTLLIKEHSNDIYNIKCPILILHGEKDNVVPINQIKNIFDKLDNQDKYFITIANGSHWILASKLEENVYYKIKTFIK